MSLSTIGGSTSTYLNYGNQTFSKQGGVQNSAYQATYNQTINTNSLTELSLGQALSTQPDKTQNDLVAQGLAQAINAATTVDPITGQQELLASASDGLTKAVTKLLTQNGFSDEEAKAATKELTSELENGGKAALTLNQSSDVTSGRAAGIANGSGSAAGAQITSSDYASQLTIGVDLASGQLSVATQSQSSFTTATATNQAGSAVGAGLNSFAKNQSGANGISAYILSVSSSNSLQAYLSAPGHQKDNLDQLINRLSDPSVADEDTTGQAIGRLSQIAAGAKKGHTATAADTAALGITVNPDGTASTAVNVRVPAAISNANRDGYGSTLYRRPDGSLGTFTVKPTRISA